VWIGDIEGVIFGFGRVYLPNHAEFNISNIFIARIRLSSETSELRPGQAYDEDIELPAIAKADIREIAVSNSEFDHGANWSRQIVI